MRGKFPANAMLEGCVCVCVCVCVLPCLEIPEMIRHRVDVHDQQIVVDRRCATLALK